MEQPTGNDGVDAIEESKIKTGKVQSYYNTLADSIFQSDPFFKHFKR
jgi:hypothetical protein